MHIEIERRFLLHSMPDLPAGAIALQIIQGYLQSSNPNDPDDTAVIRKGRLRRTSRADGSMIFHHTLKVGVGMVRQETEREISERDFDAAWPRTERQRIEKTRHVVPDGDLTWEIDEFILPPALLLAEVESHSETAALAIETPTWLTPCIEREVTDDPMYTNRAIARRAGGQ